MLDAFEILTTSGVVLWRRHYTADVSPHLINSLVSDVFIEDRQKAGTGSGSGMGVDGEVKGYRKERCMLKYTSAKEVGLCFVAVYNALLNLSWVDSLLAAVKTLFLKQYGSPLRSKQPTSATATATAAVTLDTSDFDQTFDALVRRLDTGSTRRQSDSEGPTELTPPSSSASAGEGEDGEADEPPPPPVPVPGVLKKSAVTPLKDQDRAGTSSADLTPVPTPDTSRPSTPGVVTGKAGPGGKASRRARKAQLQTRSTPGTSGDEAGSRSTTKKGSAKAKRRWDDSGVAIDDTGDDSTLDYSATADADDDAAGAALPREDVDGVSAATMGQRTGKGEFVLKDLDDEISDILAQSTSTHQPTDPTPTDQATSGGGGGLLNTATTRVTGLFRNLVGGQTLSRADLQQPLQQMQNHLLQKNVAREAAERLCASVESDLLHSKTATFTSIDATIRAAMEKALTRILTPTSSLDLLREITRTISPTSLSTSSAGATQPRPYVISIVGVNGVGKSTNLSKIAYFLLQNRLRVLVVAADTFRSGAVEQLRVHVRNLAELARRERVGSIALFEKGYGRDAASVARDAVAYAAAGDGGGRGGGGGADAGLAWDVVLIDTAGRRHNDTRLMSSLTKFGQLAQPDKIFMVGEALVGTDSVAQARNFAKEFVDGKGQLRNNGVGMDGFIISKCDTVGDMVGTLVSMVHATGIPVVFLGVGQHYGDLRQLRVGWAVERLLK